MAKNQIETVIEEVKIIAVSKKYQVKPFYATPPYNQSKGKYMTGQEDLSAEELKSHEIIVKPSDSFAIENGRVLKLEKKGDKYVPNKDYCIYKLLLNLKEEFASSRLDVTKGHLFYIENKEADAVKALGQYKLKGKASAALQNLTTLQDMVDMLYYFGENGKSYSNSRAEAYLYIKANEEPMSVLSYFEDIEVSKRIVVIKKALYHHILKRAEGTGYILHGNTPMGANETDAAAFLYDDKNNLIYIHVIDELKKVEGGK
jgi:hypothetical protein